MKRPIVLWAIIALWTKEDEGDLCVFPWLWHSKQEHMCSRNTVNKQRSSVSSRDQMWHANSKHASMNANDELTTESCCSLNETLMCFLSSCTCWEKMCYEQRVYVYWMFLADASYPTQLTVLLKLHIFYEHVPISSAYQLSYMKRLWRPLCHSRTSMKIFYVLCALPVPATQQGGAGSCGCVPWPAASPWLYSWCTQPRPQVFWLSH